MGRKWRETGENCIMRSFMTVMVLVSDFIKQWFPSSGWRVQKDRTENMFPPYAEKCLKGSV
jgi:hypothetical protein